MRRRLLVAAVLAVAATVAAAFQQATEYGPAKGSLVIAGGGSMDDAGIIEKFIELAGGADAKFVIVPTAAGNHNQEGAVRSYKFEVIGKWKVAVHDNTRLYQPWESRTSCSRRATSTT